MVKEMILKRDFARSMKIGLAGITRIVDFNFRACIESEL